VRHHDVLFDEDYNLYPNFWIDWSTIKRAELSSGKVYLTGISHTPTVQVSIGYIATQFGFVAAGYQLIVAFHCTNEDNKCVVYAAHTCDDLETARYNKMVMTYRVEVV
jgi:hypothetical protein